MVILDLSLLYLKSYLGKELLSYRRLQNWCLLASVEVPVLAPPPGEDLPSLMSPWSSSGHCFVVFPCAVDLFMLLTCLCFNRWESD